MMIGLTMVCTCDRKKFELIIFQKWLIKSRAIVIYSHFILEKIWTHSNFRIISRYLPDFFVLFGIHVNTCFQLWKNKSGKILFHITATIITTIILNRGVNLDINKIDNFFLYEFHLRPIQLTIRFRNLYPL